jgi:hypothetical protein
MKKTKATRPGKPSKHVALTIKEVEVRREEELAYEKERDANLYKGERALAYPPMADQLDKIFHEGLEAWKTEIQAIKDKYPKV